MNLSLASAAPLELLLQPADRLRSRVLRALGPLARPWTADRELRVGLLGSMTMLAALAATLVAPLWLLALGPILLGVPHLLADVRYLWVRPGYHRRLVVWIAVAGPLAAGAVTGRAYFGVIAALGALAVARTTRPRRVLGLALFAALLAVVLESGRVADIAFAHLHNFFAVGLWWAWRPRAKRWHLLPLALFAVASLLLGTGALGALAGTGAPARSLGMAYHLHVLAPFAAPELGVRLVLLFAFAQAVHYGVWLRLVPEEDRDRPAPRGFASSYRALRADLGPIAIAITGLLALGLAAWAVADLLAARAGYFRFAAFHGQLELAAAALLWAERARR